MKIKKHLCALLSAAIMLGTAVVVPITANAGVAENTAILNSLHEGDIIEKGTTLDFSGISSYVEYYYTDADETPYSYDSQEGPDSVYIGGKHDYYVIREVSGDPGSEWKGMYMGDGAISLKLVGCYYNFYIIGDGRNNWLYGNNWEPVYISENDSDPLLYECYFGPVKPGDYEFYFGSDSGDRFGGTFPGFGETFKLEYNAPNIKFTVDEVSDIRIVLSHGNLVVSKIPKTYAPPTAAYEQVGKDYPADAVNVHGASLWKVNVDTGTFAANELNVKVNGKTAGEPIVNMNGFTGSVVFGVVLNGVKDDIQSFDVLVDGESAIIE